MSTDPAPTRAERMQAAIGRVLLGLPAPLQRLLAGGRSTRRDGLTLEADVQLALALLAVANETPFEELPPIDARRAIARRARMVAGAPLPLARVEALSLPGPDGPIPARFYASTRDGVGEPLLVYYHGGGWVIGDLDTHDPVCRFLAREARVRVLSVAYRLAPEHRFPAAVEDACAALRFVTGPGGAAARLGVDPRRVAVGGDSAGGNLAAVVAQLAPGERDAVAPAFQLLFYPVTDVSEKAPSYRLFADGFFLTERQMDWFRDHYVARREDTLDPRVSPLLAKDLAGVAPAYVATAGFDPLRDEGEAYAARLREAGASVTLRRHPGLIHGFCNTTAFSRSARAAMLEAAAALREGLHVR